MKRTLPNDPRKPWVRLLPIADALATERGYTQTRPNGPESRYFGPFPGGFQACFAEPLDFAWIESTFELPDSVYYVAESDELRDFDNFVMIQGGVSDVGVRS